MKIDYFVVALAMAAMWGLGVLSHGAALPRETLSNEEMLQMAANHQFDIFMYGEKDGWGRAREIRDQIPGTEKTDHAWRISGESKQRSISTKKIVSGEIEVTTRMENSQFVEMINLRESTLKVLVFCRNRNCTSPKEFYARLNGIWHRL